MGIDLTESLTNSRAVGLAVKVGTSVLFEDLFVRHYPDVFRYALVLTSDRDEAEEVAAETFARAWRAWSHGKEPHGKQLAWLLAIARNLATDRWRRLSRYAGRFLSANSSDRQAEVEAILWLESLVRVLPARQREVIVLRYHRDLNDADIGRLMGLTESGVRSLVGRALARLREHPEAWQ
jgi:RNA polymerase sigma-70 factor, ECF subfamily